MSRYDENSNTELERVMLIFEYGVFCGNPLQLSGYGAEPDTEPNREFGPVADNTVSESPNNGMFPSAMTLISV